jgi:hypothetical protein
VRLLLVTCAVAMAGCGGGGEKKATTKRTLDTDKVARAITDSIKSQRDLDATVACPTGIPQQTGYKFACLATYEGGTTTFTVDQTDNKGHVKYEGK